MSVFKSLPFRLCVVGVLAFGFVLLVSMITQDSSAANFAGGGAAEQVKVAEKPLSGEKSAVIKNDVPAPEIATPQPEKSAVSSAVESSSQPQARPASGAEKGYAIDVSVANQVVTIFKDGQVVRSMPASTGKADTPTPLGDFKIENFHKNFFFAPEFQEGAYYMSMFDYAGDNAFHSIPTDKDGNEIPAEAAMLGKPASHGCIRLKRPDAKWLYESMPNGTPIHIHN